MDWEFTGNLDLAALDKVPADLRGFYRAKEGGGFEVPAELRGAASTFDGLRKSLGKSREAERTAKGSVEAWTKIGATPEDVTGRLSTLETQLAEATKGKGDPQKIRAEIQAAFEKDRETLTGQVTRMRNAVERHLIADAATQALTAHKAMSVEVLLPHVQKAVRVVEGDDGEFRAIVVDEKGEPRYRLVDGNPLTVEDYVKELKAGEKFAPFFLADNPGGSGTPPGGGAGGPRLLTKDPSKMSPGELISAGLRAQKR